MSESNEKRGKLEKKLKELEDIAKERYFNEIDSPANFLMEYLNSEEYEEWSNIIGYLSGDKKDE